MPTIVAPIAQTNSKKLKRDKMSTLISSQRKVSAIKDFSTPSRKNKVIVWNPCFNEYFLFVYIYKAYFLKTIFFNIKCFHLLCHSDVNSSISIFLIILMQEYTY